MILTTNFASILIQLPRKLRPLATTTTTLLQQKPLNYIRFSSYFLAAGDNHEPQYIDGARCTCGEDEPVCGWIRHHLSPSISRRFQSGKLGNEVKLPYCLLSLNNSASCVKWVWWWGMWGGRCQSMTTYQATDRLMCTHTNTHTCEDASKKIAYDDWSFLGDAGIQFRGGGELLPGRLAEAWPRLRRTLSISRAVLRLFSRRIDLQNGRLSRRLAGWWILYYKPSNLFPHHISVFPFFPPLIHVLSSYFLLLLLFHIS